MLARDEGSIEEAGGPGGLGRYSGRRVELVQKVAKEWTAALEDLGGRNNLLNYRDLKQGTLDLTSADPQALRGLLAGKEVKLSSLFGDPEAREQSLRRLRTVHNKAKENFEERGLETASIACGLATWDNQRAAWVPNAPVLLRRATVRALGAAQDEFGLALVDDMEVNPTLLHVLRVDFICEFDHEALAKRIPDGSIDEPWELEEAYAWISEQVGPWVPGFRVEPRVVLANFAYAKLPMVKDIESALDELVAHPLIAAIAGDEESKEVVREQGPGPRCNTSARPGTPCRRVPRPRRRLEPELRDQQRDRRAEPDDQGPAGHGEEPDDRQPDRLARGSGEKGNVRGRKARRHRGSDQAPAAARPGRPRP